MYQLRVMPDRCCRVIQSNAMVFVMVLNSIVRMASCDEGTRIGALLPHGESATGEAIIVRAFVDDVTSMKASFNPRSDPDPST